MYLNNYESIGSVTKALIAARPADVYSVRITNANAALRYLLLLNKATAPAAADAPAYAWAIPGGTAGIPGVLHLDTRHFAPFITFTVGLGWAVSTTAASFTDSATASEHGIDLNYQ